MGFLKDVGKNALGCVFIILFFLALIFAVLSLALDGWFGLNPWIGFGVFFALAIIFGAIIGAIRKRK